MASPHAPRHRPASPSARLRRPSRRTVLTLGALGALAGTAVTAAVVSSAGESVPAACSQGSRPLHVAAAPEIAPVVRSAVAERSIGDPACPAALVTTAEPAETAALIKGSGPHPDVWVPDSSIWTAQLAGLPNLTVPTANPSVARSPFVLAVAAQLAATVATGKAAPSVTDLVAAPGRPAAPVQWALPDPALSSGTVAAIIGLQTALADRADSPAVLTDVLRGSKRDLGTTSGPATLAQAAANPLAVPATEQEVTAHNRLFPNGRLVAAYPTATLYADYPYVVLATDQARRAEAAQLLTALQSEPSRSRLTDAGFQDPAQPAEGAVPDPAAVASATRALTSITRGSKLLAVLDVSGSMTTAVPGAKGANRLELALQAAVNGLALYPDDTVAGLWTFSTNLTPTSDHRQVVPLVSLARGADGSSGRQRLAQGLATVTATDGWTGLYDTVLAAVREVRKDWDPQRVSSVVLITDGANEDPQGGIDLPTLLQTLRQENDPARPVQVFAIAYGPAGDLASLQQITSVTGGRAYAARDPRTVGSVMLDAIGRRACAPGC